MGERVTQDALVVDADGLHKAGWRPDQRGSRGRFLSLSAGRPDLKFCQGFPLRFHPGGRVVERVSAARTHYGAAPDLTGAEPYVHRSPKRGEAPPLT